MTPTQLAVFTIVALLFVQIMKRQRARFECPYCGRYKGHDDHCPYTTAL